MRIGGEVPTLYATALGLCEEPSPSVELVTATVLRLRDAGECARYFTGGLLCALRRGNAWRKSPESANRTFGEFCEQALGASYRSCLYMISVYEKAVSLGLLPERLAEIGWKKAREFVPIATAENLEEWISRAQAMDGAAFVREVRAARARQQQAGAQADALEPGAIAIPEPLVSLIVRVTEDQRQNIEAAIEQAAQQRKGRPLSRGDALDLLCTDWRANNITSQDRTIEWYVAQLRRVYGVRVAVVEEVPRE